MSAWKRERRGRHSRSRPRGGSRGRRAEERRRDAVPAGGLEDRPLVARREGDDDARGRLGEEVDRREERRLDVQVGAPRSAWDRRLGERDGEPSPPTRRARRRGGRLPRGRRGGRPSTGPRGGRGAGRALVAAEDGREVLAPAELVARLAEERHDVVLGAEGVRHRPGDVVEETHHPDGRRREDRLAVRLVVERDVPRDDGRSRGPGRRGRGPSPPRRAGLGDLRPLGVAEVETVRDRERPRPRARHVQRAASATACAAPRVGSAKQ